MTRVWRKDKRIIKIRKNFLRKRGLILKWNLSVPYVTISDIFLEEEEENDAEFCAVHTYRSCVWQRC